eukprot:scaffold5110_cov69-Cyclotella_meneghiniana.AAC.5
MMLCGGMRTDLASKCPKFLDWTLLWDLCIFLIRVLTPTDRPHNLTKRQPVYLIVDESPS